MWRAIQKFLVRVVVVPLAALFFFIEDYIWVHIADAVAWIARLRVIQRIEARIARLGPYPAMALFLVPLALSWCVKLFGLYLLANERFATAIAVIVAGKIVGTAFAARLFAVTKPALLQVKWFAGAYGWVMRTKDWLYARVRAMPAYIATRRAMHRMKLRLRLLFRRRGESGAWGRYISTVLARGRRRGPSAPSNRNG